MDFDRGTTFKQSHPARNHSEMDYVRTFYSLRDFAETANQCPSGTRAESNENEWCGGSREDALRMALGDGWADAKPEIDSISAHVSRLVDATTIADGFEWTHDVSGGMVDVAAFLQGEPECMIESMPVKVAKRGKVIRLIVPAQYSASVSTEIIKRRGAAVCALIDAMAAAHYSLEIWAVMSGSNRKMRFTYSVKIQDAADTYRADMIAYALGHPTMLRKLMFLVMDQDCQSTRTMVGRGSPMQSRLTDIPEELQDGPAIVMPMLKGNDSPWNGTDADIAAWIECQVKSISETDSE